MIEPSNLRFRRDIPGALSETATNRPAKPDSNPFAFSGSVGPFGENRREDVIKAQLLLGNSGDYDLASLGAPTGWPGGELWRGIKQYQKRKGLAVDGTLLPPGEEGVDENGVGETIHALHGDLGQLLSGYAAPDPSEVDAHYDERARRRTRHEDDNRPLSRISVADETGSTPHPIGTVPSDAGNPSPPSWRDGAQLAQAVPIQVVPPPPPGGQRRPHQDGGVTPEEKQLSQMLEQQVGKTINLLTVPTRIMNHVLQSGAAITPAPDGKPTPSSRPMSDAEQAATKTPPFAPPKVDPKLHGRPAEEHKPDIEKLIPPRMKEWMEGRDAFDQALAKELLLVFNSRGGDSTQAGNDLIVKEIFDVLDKNHPRLRKWMTHTHGATLNGEGGKALKEEFLKNVDENGEFYRRGSGRPDITVEYARGIAERLRFNSSSQNADGTWTNPEDDQADKHAALTKERRPVMLEKLQEGEKEEIYRGKIRPRIEDAMQQYEAELTEQGEFEKPDPEIPAQYRYWYQK